MEKIKLIEVRINDKHTGTKDIINVFVPISSILFLIPTAENTYKVIFNTTIEGVGNLDLNKAWATIHSSQMQIFK